MRSLELDLIEEFGTATFSIKDPLYKALGWAPKEDDRDYAAEDFIATEKLERTSGRQLWVNPLQGNQFKEGACVGGGWWGFLNSHPYPHAYANQVLFDIYNAAKRVDAWPGENYEGTSVRAGAKVVQQGLVPHVGRHIQTYAFTSNVDTLALHVLNKGPAVIGVDWYTGMDRVDSLGFVYPTGTKRGGHCVVIDGVTWDYKDVKPNRFRFRNTWGPDWGFNGRGRISASDLQSLFSQGGTACLAVEVHNQ